MTETNRKLALFVPTLGGGGAERNMVKLANGFVQKGYEVDFLLVAHEGPYKDDLSPEVRVIKLGGRRTLGCLPSLRRYLIRESPRAILSTTLFANVITLLAKMFSRVPTRVVIRESNNLEQLVSYSPGWRFRLMPPAVRLLYPRADRLVAVSEGVGENLIRYLRVPDELVSVIHHPVVDDALFEAANAKVEHPFIDDRSSKLVLGVGRLNEQKDFETLIRAFHIVWKQRPVRLLILGEGPLRSDLEELVRTLGIEEEVDMPGFVENPFKYMKNADLFVLSSRWEGLPGVLIQAMACDCPVVSTDCPSGPREVLEDGRWGALVPPGDAEAMARAMQHKLDEEGKADLAERADRFRTVRAVEGYLKVLVD